MWARMRTRLARENLFLENPSFWNGYTQACTDPNRSRLLSFPGACKWIKCWRAPKRFGAKKQAKSAQKLPKKKRKSTAAGTQVLIGKDSTAGKRRWSRGKEKAKQWWKIQRSAQTDGENKPVTIEYLLLSQKDSHLTYFRTPNLFHCAGAAQWSSLRATNFPLAQLSDLAWLPTLLFCGSADEPGGLADHGSKSQCVSPTELQSAAQQ